MSYVMLKKLLVDIQVTNMGKCHNCRIIFKHKNLLDGSNISNNVVGFLCVCGLNVW